MAHGVEDLLSMLYEYISEAFTLPLGNDKCVIDKDKALGLLDEINATLPGDLQQARSIVENRNDILAAAKKEADTIRRNAEEKARLLVSEQEILTVARQKASDLMSMTESKSRDVRRATNEYVDNLLKRTEEAVSTALNEVRQSRVEFRNTSRKGP